MIKKKVVTDYLLKKIFRRYFFYRAGKWKQTISMVGLNIETQIPLELTLSGVMV